MELLGPERMICKWRNAVMVAFAIWLKSPSRHAIAGELARCWHPSPKIPNANPHEGQYEGSSAALMADGPGGLSDHPSADESTRARLRNTYRDRRVPLDPKL